MTIILTIMTISLSQDGAVPALEKREVSVQLKCNKVLTIKGDRFVCLRSSIQENSRAQVKYSTDLASLCSCIILLLQIAQDIRLLWCAIQLSPVDEIYLFA
jgi:hypothetical protein